MLHKHGELLYTGVSDTIREHLTPKVADLLAVSPDALLLRLREVWDTHVREMRLIRDVLMYMDRSFVPTQLPRRMPTNELGLVMFRDCVLRSPQLRPRITRAALEAVAGARAGAIVDGSGASSSVGLLRASLSMLVELGVYTEEFEVPFLDASRALYAAESASVFSRGSASAYLSWVATTLESERACAAALVSPRTLTELATMLERTLIADHAVAVVEAEDGGLVSLLEASSESANASLSRMLALFGLCKEPVPWPERAAVPGRTSGLSSLAASGLGADAFDAGEDLTGPSTSVRMVLPVNVMRDAFKAHVLVCGRALLSDPVMLREPAAYVERLIALRRRFSEGVVDGPLRGAKEFARVLKEAFETLLNVQGDTRPADFLVAYLDDLFRSGFGGASDAIVEEMLAQVVILFRLLANKDEFEERYKAALQRRLLGGKIANDDFERLMISKLKHECGFQFTSKLEGMFHDWRLSAALMEKYSVARRARATATPTADVSVDVTVLTKTNWPSARFPTCVLPAELSAAVADFRDFYLAQHTGRRLEWYTEKGTADVGFNVAPGRRYEVTVSTYQMAVLVLFNEPLAAAQGLPFARIVEATGVAREELLRHVLSLANPKFRILNKSSKGRELNDDDVLTVNSDFTSKLMRVKVPLISASSAAASGLNGASTGGGDDISADVAAQIESQRKSMIEAAIVRILKARKSIDHQNLVSVVVRQLSFRFRPQPVDIKKRVEELIERDYIERDASDRQLYSCACGTLLAARLAQCTPGRLLTRPSPPSPDFRTSPNTDVA